MKMKDNDLYDCVLINRSLRPYASIDAKRTDDDNDDDDTDQQK